MFCMFASLQHGVGKSWELCCVRKKKIGDSTLAEDCRVAAEGMVRLGLGTAVVVYATDCLLHQQNLLENIKGGRHFSVVIQNLAPTASTGGSTTFKPRNHGNQQQCLRLESNVLSVLPLRSPAFPRSWLKQIPSHRGHRVLLLLRRRHHAHGGLRAPRHPDHDR